MKLFVAVLVTILAVLVAVFGVGIYRVHAQTGNPLNITVSGTHTSCTAPATGVTTFCFATDGLWQSLNGSAYVQLGPTAAVGVSSWNGLTGAVTYTPPPDAVTSVNGKTGAVVLGATTTVQ